MAKPLRSDNPNPEPARFKHFGVLNPGTSSRGAAITSIAINCSLALIIVILGMVAKNNPVMAKKIADLTLPPQPKVEPPKPKPPPPPPPKLPPPPKVETPKIEPPKVKLPEVEKPPEIKPVVVPTPKPVMITPPAPKKVDPPPAPKVVSINNMAAHVPNNDAHPSPVHAGYDMIKTTGPAVAAKVNIGGGIQGMPAGNTGNGPRATTVSMGSGIPGGSNVNSHDRGAVKITGLTSGTPGGTGHGPAGPTAVAIAGPTAATPARPAAVMHTMATKPTLVYKPTPVYSAEAKAAHIEGNVTVRIRVLASGSTQFVSITHGLGHGLDESARQVVQGMRWKPALDETGHPTEWTGDVIVSFLMS